jgi:hypothetical protein
MHLYIKETKLRHRGHKTLMVGEFVPNWFERILLKRERKPVAFLGKGTVWHRYPELDSVPKHVTKYLDDYERKFVIGKNFIG